MYYILYTIPLKKQENRVCMYTPPSCATHAQATLTQQRSSAYELHLNFIRTSCELHSNSFVLVVISLFTSLTYLVLVLFTKDII